MPKYWESTEQGVYTTLRACEDEHCDGAKLLDEIITHYIAHYKASAVHAEEKPMIIIDILELEFNWKEFLSFRGRLGIYQQDYSICLTF